MSENILDQLQPNWLAKRTILLAQAGSFAYGTSTENSDRDYKGVCIPPIDYYLGLHSFSEYNSSGGKNFKNTKDDVDMTILHVTKFVKDAMKGVPNNIELLFIEPNLFIKLHHLGQMLLDHRHLFLSKQIYQKFAGYAHSQVKLLHKSKTAGTGNKDLIGQFGYDTKLFMHAIRLLTSAIEILETGDFHTYHPKRKMLMDCRTGRYSFDEAVSMINHYDEELMKAYSLSELPDKPDLERVNQLLIDINRAGLYF